MNLLIKLVINTIAIIIAAYVLPGIRVDGITAALIVAILLGVVNAILKPILVILTLPITILTLGLFTFVINALLVLLVDQLVPGFDVVNFWWALLFSVIVSLVSSFLEQIVN